MLPDSNAPLGISTLSPANGARTVVVDVELAGGIGGDADFESLGLFDVRSQDASNPTPQIKCRDKRPVP